MTKKLVLMAGLLAAGAMTGEARAEPAAPGKADACALPDSATAEADSSRLTGYKNGLASQRARLADRLSDLRALPQPDAKAISDVSDQIELNAVAMANVEAMLKSLTTLRVSLAECEAAKRRLELAESIAGLQADDSDRKAVMAAESKAIAEKMAAARKARDELESARPLTESYTRLAARAEAGAPVPPATGGPVRRAENSASQDDRAKPDDCDLMIAAPVATLRIGTCASEARLRSARSLAGGDVAFPSSVLRPRGITANLTGGSSDGTLSLGFADTFAYRRTPERLPDGQDASIQLPWEWGYSVGLSAKDGLIFKRDDIFNGEEPDTRIRDALDGNATFKLGFFVNVFEGETLGEWSASAAKLSDEATKACRKDQASGDSKTPSTCTGLSLTNWVYAIDENGALRRPDLANQANALYFNSKDDKAKWGGGIDFSFSRGNFDYLDPAVFVANPAAEPLSDGDWNYGATLYGFWRMTGAKAPVGISAVPSLTYSSRFGYPVGTTQRQFCQALTAGVPFVTGSCKSYYTAPPERYESWTPSLELRVLTNAIGPIPPLGISPRISFVRNEGSTADRTELAIPVLVFVESEKGLGVGFQYSRTWGGVSDTAEPDGSFEDLPTEDSLKIVVSKTFSLSGK